MIMTPKLLVYITHITIIRSYENCLKICKGVYVCVFVELMEMSAHLNTKKALERTKNLVCVF
jgi:hypothetical protein